MTTTTRRAGVRERLSYAFDRFMERGTAALIAGLALLSMVVIVGMVGVTLIVRGADDPGDPIQLVWMALMRTLDAGTMGGDEGSPGFLLGMLGVTIGGIFVISTLIGILSSGLEQKLDALRQGRSRVLEQDHVLILGWSQQVFAVISELLEAGASRRRTSIVVMADRDRTEMEREIRDRVAIPKRARIVCRSGRPTDLGDLAIANPDASRAIVVLAPEGDDPDVGVIKTILALTGRPGRRAEPYRIVAEVRQPANAGVAKLIGHDDVHLILSDDLLARIIAQTCRQSGLSVVYQELLDFAGQEFHVEALPALVGRTFGDAVQLITGGVAIGLVRDDRAHLNPSRDRVIDAADKVVVLAEDHGSTRVATTAAEVDEDAIATPAPHDEIPERILILGWNGRGATIVSQLDAYVPPGSELVAVSAVERVVADVEGLRGLRHLRATARAADTTHRNLLDELDVASFDHVVVLCESDDRPAESADARTLVTLLHLRDIGTRGGRDFSIVSEMLDVRDRELAEIARADDFIVSARVLSLLLAQVAETPELAEVFRDLFDAGGSEVYLREAAEYVALGREVSFATIQEAAQRRGEVAMGYRVGAQANDKAAAYGVVLNPGRDTRLMLALEDRVIVLAEE